MTRVVMIHNRPHDNDCFDDFARHYADRGLEWRHWRDIPPDADLYVSCLQDPVGAGRAKAVTRAVGDRRLLNPPAVVNAALRQTLYPKWRAAGLLCPTPPYEFDYDRMVEEAAFPYLVKDLSKQMGRGFVIESVERLDWLYLESSRFDVDRFQVLPFVTLRNKDGYTELHRYIVAGGKVMPGVYAKTKKWNCKASHMAKDIVGWDEAQRRQYARELEEFWRSTPHPDVLRAVEVSGLDFCTVDSSLTADGRPFFWELNPMVNLPVDPGEVAGKQTTWWRFMANYLLGLSEPIEWPSGWAQVENLLSWKGYKPFWTKKLEEGDE